jgi:hypothetical protein
MAPHSFSVVAVRIRRLALNRNPDPALAQTDRADNALAADNINVRHGGVQVVNIALALALGARLIRARPGKGRLIGHAPCLLPQLAGSIREPNLHDLRRVPRMPLRPIQAGRRLSSDTGKRVGQ